MASNEQTGFTILELMIAISVFTIAIVLVSSGVIQIGRDYRHGATRAKINTFARELHAKFTQEIQYSGEKPVILTSSVPGGYDKAICMGTTRYLLTEPTGSNPGSIGMDTVAGPSACNAAPGAIVSNPLPKDSGYTRFNITAPVGIGVYSLDTRFVIGQQDMFVGDNFDNVCKPGNLLGGEFCAVIELKSEMARKVTGS